MIPLPPNAALELPIDELSLLVLKDLTENRNDSEYNYLYHYTEDRTYGYQTNPEACNAIAEAIAWLRGRGMVAHRPLDSRPASILVTRWGKKALESGLQAVRATERLQENLHPEILQKARRQFLLGEYEMAVFVAMKAVEVRVRQLGGFGEEVIGVDLMTKAFNKDGPLADKSAPPGEIDGTMMLFRGTYAVLRNPSGHRNVEFDDVTEAAEAVGAASLLMRILDRVEKRLANSS